MCENVRMPAPRTRPDAWLLRSERQARILELVAIGVRRVSDLADRLGVSPMTIRRDADELAALGRVERVRGGVTLARQPTAWEPPPSTKQQLHPGEKHRIAQAAAHLLRPGMAVGLGAGTTTLAVARALVGTPNLTVVTNAIPVALALDPDATVVLTGGERTPSDALVGPIANRAAEGLSLDVLILGAHGVDAARGCTTPNLQEAETNRALIGAARSIVVVADASKWGELGLAAFAALEEIDVLVTDTALPRAAQMEASKRVPRLLVV